MDIVDEQVSGDDDVSSISGDSPTPNSEAVGSNFKRKRQKKSDVWQFYNHVMSGNKDEAVCKNCPAKYSMKSGSAVGNMRYHLKSKHKLSFDLLTKNDTEKKKSKEEDILKVNTIQQLRPSSSASDLPSPTARQLTLDVSTFSFNQPKAMSLLAIFLSTSEAATNLVTNKWFKDFCQTLNPRFKVPGYKTMVKKISEVSTTIENKIASKILNANYLHLCIDLWSKKDMTSYMGITVHFYDHETKGRSVVGLALEPVQGKHTAENIYQVFDRIIKKWKIPRQKIFKILTDNGANVIKAFKDVINFEIEEELDHYDEQTADNIVDPNLDESFDEESPLLPLIDDLESYSSFIVCRKQLRCLVHSLQLVVRFAVKLEKFSPSISDALKIINKFSKSSVGTEKLLAKGGLRLVSHCPTRWNTIYFVIERLLELRDSVNSSCLELDWPILQPDTWNALILIKKILRPFAIISEEIASQTSVTISLFIPYYTSLLEQISALNSIDYEVSNLLQTEVRRRFSFIVDPSHLQFDPIFATCLLLDPRYNAVLNLPQYRCLRSIAESQLELLIKHTPNVQAIEIPSRSNLDNEEENDFLDMILEDQNNRKKGLTIQNPVEDELKRFLNEPNFPKKCDPYEFWSGENGRRYPLLSSIAFDLLAIPASTASVERMFSKCGLSCLGRKNRLCNSNLENKVLIRMNHDLL